MSTPTDPSLVVLTASDAELLAQVCAGRRCERPAPLPSWSRGLLGLSALTEEQAMAMLGLRRTAARRLLWAFALHRRLLVAAQPAEPQLTMPEQIAAVMHPLAVIDHERLWCLPLDPHLRLIGEPIEISRGDVDGTDVSARGFCRAALRAGAVGAIAVHNHPSGDVSPSAADRAVTRRLVEAGRAIDIRVYDHVIVNATGGCYSLSRSQPELFR